MNTRTMDTEMKVGALAERTGLTVRTLHHYDEIGLLRPARNAAGHRVYGVTEVRRLQQIASLRHLGISLDDIRACIDRPEYALDAVLALQMERIDAQIERQRQLRTLIERLRERLESTDGASMDELTRTIDVTVNYERYFTADQLSTLERRRGSVGEERMRAAEGEWSDLFAAFGRAMEQGADPASADVVSLARRSSALIEEFTGGDPAIAASLGKMYRAEGGPTVLGQHGVALPDGLWDYMGRARAALAAQRSEPGETRD